MMRPLNVNEKNLIARFAEKLNAPERERLLDDAAQATAKEVTPDASRIMFEIAGYHHPPYRGQHSYGVDGKMLDSDGVELSVCLYADENGRLLELEFIRWDPNDLQSPRWETLEII